MRSAAIVATGVVLLLADTDAPVRPTQRTARATSPLTVVAAQGQAPADGTPRVNVGDCWWRMNRRDDTPPCQQYRRRIMNLWLNEASYYALVEIVDARLEPGLGKMRRQEVIDLLGTKSMDPDYPNARRDNFLVWGSDRLVPFGSHLVVQFDRRGVLESYDWVSE